LLREPLTMQSYLDARLIADPLGLFDCVMPCAGAEGFLVLEEGRARELGIPFARLLASAERHNGARGVAMPMQLGWHYFRDELYASAGIIPGALDIVQVYDDYPIMVFLQLEELGLFAQGEASRHLTEEGFFNGDRLVNVNTSGGQLSAGQAGFAGGFMGLTETVRQLTSRALGNQLWGVNTALVSGFGMINYDRGLCTAAAVLEKVE